MNVREYMFIMCMRVCACVQVEAHGSAAVPVSMMTMLSRALWRMHVCACVHVYACARVCAGGCTRQCSSAIVDDDNVVTCTVAHACVCVYAYVYVCVCVCLRVQVEGDGSAAVPVSMTSNVVTRAVAHS